MKRLFICLMFGIAACGSDPADPEPGPQGQEGTVDYCTEFGWYGDGHCDDVCPRPDPDCSDALNNVTPDPDPDPGPGPGPGPGPDPVDPDPTDPPPPVPVDPVCEDLVDDGLIEWVSQDPDECAEIRFTCADDQVAFSSEECGCGCITELDTGLACLDDTVPTVERYGDVRECELIDFACGEGWTYFADDCGCGCQLVCSDDFECPNGYCQLNVDAETTCVYPNCDDGTQLQCRMAEPDCGPGNVAAVINGCYECLDARTCGPPMGP